MPPGIRFLPAPTQAQEPNYNVNAHGGLLCSHHTDPERAEDGRLECDGPAAKGRDTQPRKANSPF